MHICLLETDVLSWGILRLTSQNMSEFNQTINSLPPKSAFSLGLVGGILIVFALGFFILLGIMVKDDSIKLSLNTGTETNEAAAVADTNPAPTPEPTQPTQPSPPPEVTNRDWIRGPADAGITLIEYADFDCPYCGAFHSTMQQIAAEYPNDVRWIYRHFPLSFHPNAQKKAEAAECAGELGGSDKFWQFTDAMFERAPEVTGLAALANELGIDQSAMQNCLDSDKYAQYVADQMNSGAAAGVRGTPGTFAIDSSGEAQYIPGALPFESVKQVVESIL